MKYWDPETLSCYAAFQLQYRTEEIRARLVAIEDDVWHKAREMVKTGYYHIENDPNTNTPIAVINPEPTEKDKLIMEREQCQAYLQDTQAEVIDYLEKLVTGAQPMSANNTDENIITKRNKSKARIEEIDQQLASMV